MAFSWLSSVIAQAADAPQLPSVTLSTAKDINIIPNFILKILLAFAFPLAVAAIAYTAYILITGMGNPDAYTKAKKNLMYLLIGLFLIVGAVVMINFLKSFYQP